MGGSIRYGHDGKAKEDLPFMDGMFIVSSTLVHFLLMNIYRFHDLIGDINFKLLVNRIRALSMPNFQRALLFSTCLFSFLTWAYIVFRIVINNINPLDRFIYWIPIQLYVLGIISFFICFICMTLYLAFWGFSKDRWSDSPIAFIAQLFLDP